jgi:hypothetical protein
VTTSFLCRAGVCAPAACYFVDCAAQVLCNNSAAMILHCHIH